MDRKLSVKIKKVYLKKFCDIGKFSVWIVNGEYIRTNIDEEFTNYGGRYRFSYIPKNEFWIDRESAPGEERYYIDSMLLMNRLIFRGMNYERAMEKRDAMEKSERAKGVVLAKGLGSLPKEELLKKVKMKLMKEYSGRNVKVWIVDGELVRSLFFVSFTEGGHDRVYRFVPKGEIWIDNDVSAHERKFVLVHEAHERNLMATGMCYDDAHADSSRVEFFCRHHLGKVDGELKRELGERSRGCY